MTLKPLCAFAFFTVLLNSGTLNSLSAQNSNQVVIDSLIAELPKAEPDTNKVNLLNDISNAYKRIDPEKGVEYGEQGFALAEEINWIKGKVITLSNTGVNYFFMGDYFAAIPKLLQSLDYAEEIQHTRAIAQNAIILGLSFERTNQNEPALEYYLRSIEPYKKTNITAAATAMKNAANIYINLENYPGALAMATELYDYSTENGLESRQADAYVVRGRAYLALSNYPLAQQNFFKAISIFEKYDMRRRMSDGYLSIGVVFQTLEEYEKALEYYNKALVISEELGEKETNALILSDIGDPCTTFVNSIKKHASITSRPSRFTSSMKTMKTLT